MSELYETIQYRGVDIEIYYDDCSESPRGAWEHYTTIWSNCKGYNPDRCSIDDLLNELDLSSFSGSFAKLCKIADAKGYFAIPVYALIHSDISLSLNPYSDPWDSGTFGVVTIPKETIYKEYGCKRICKKLKEKLTSYIAEELKEYENWCNGLVFGYRVIDEDGNEDCCGGYYGYDFENNCLLESARGIVDWNLKEKDKKAVQFWNNNTDKDVA